MKVSFKNNFVSLTDQTFPGVNELFSSPAREGDGHEKWVDFAAEFWHCECVCGLSQNAFTQRYQRWCKQHGYHFQQSKAGDIYVAACGHVSVVAKCDTIKVLVTQAAIQINTISEALAAIAREMKRLAAMLPEAQVVSRFYGVYATKKMHLAFCGVHRHFMGFSVSKL